MKEQDRRGFIKTAALTTSTFVLSAYGGGKVSAEAFSRIPTTSPTQPITPDPLGTPKPTPTQTLARTGAILFTLQSPTTQTAAPFSLGYAFRRADVPPGQGLVSNIHNLQVTSKNFWPDGSLKFAVISGTVDLTANAPVIASLTSGAPTTAPALTTAYLRDTGCTASVSSGRFGTAFWESADWATPFQTWINGPHMSSWVYRKPIGSDAHLVAWLEVRLFSSGAVEVLPWIENGYLRVPGPTNKADTFTFTLGNSQRFSGAIDLKHHQRTPLVNGTALSYWLQTDPAVTPRHDVQYLQSTELVPTYRAKVSPTAPIVAKLAAEYVPLQQGNFNYDNDSMPSAGYQDPIGLLPQHDVLYLTATDNNAYAAVVRNGYSSGRYAIHYRDESTNRPLRFSQYPSLVISDNSSFKDNGGSTTSSYTPTISGLKPPTWDVAHSPSVGFMAYLITGRWYFMEEVQFAATANYLGENNNPLMRSGSQGLVQTTVGAWQTRSCAWGWRTLVQALCITPDDDTALRSEFIASVKSNIDHFHGRYVAQANNPYGWIKPGEAYINGNIRFGAPWQQDFVTAAFGYSVALGLPIPSDYAKKLASFFQWKAKSVVSRLGSSAGFWHINATPYTMTITPSATPDYEGGTGPWYRTDAEVYAATYHASPAWLGNKEGQLAGEILPGERSLWGNLLTALAYAVQHNVPGALESYNRLTGATNWPALRNAFDRSPVWSVAPSAAAPAWLAGKPLNQWFEIPGTAGAGGSAVDAYSGMALKDSTSEIIISLAGGHLDSSDNRVVSLALSSDQPTWTLRHAPGPVDKRNVAYNPDGQPASRHTYQHSHYIPSLDKVIHLGARSVYGDSWDFTTVDGFSLRTNSWDPAGTWANTVAGYGAGLVRATGVVYSTGGLHKWTPTGAGVWSNPITSRTNDIVRWPIAHDTLRDQLFTLQWGDGMGYNGERGVQSTKVPLSGATQYQVTYTPSAAYTQFQADKPTYAAMDYEPNLDQFFFYCGIGSGAGRIYVIKPNNGTTLDMEILALGAGSLTPPPVPSAGVHNRFRYVPALRGFVLLAIASSNLYFIRTS